MTENTSLIRGAFEGHNKRREYSMAHSTGDTSDVGVGEVLRAINGCGPITWQEAAAATFDGEQERGECGHSEYKVRDGVDIDDYVGETA